MVSYGNPKIASYFEKLDAKLSGMPDDGEKAICLQNLAAQNARFQRKLADDPWSMTASAFDLTEIADGIELRLSRLRESIRAKIAEATSQIPPCHDISDMRAA
ncbi:hypothetical protein [Methylobacterium bullatum]|uniref:Uncharacterized protein n=1 Tax=Methylobacterium bullatum TaxID=570505 RepID=A0AAV4ZCV6_9HYPH|nr:hypothetical protein [Methylobacterium bullatum]MBD8902740.1 hypothetical protein [Methylobacterium bullatum]GJD41354.1 hypothetical protein OICFNHDK_3837 [Methylobacterium bullatum]